METIQLLLLFIFYLRGLFSSWLFVQQGFGNVRAELESVGLVSYTVSILFVLTCFEKKGRCTRLQFPILSFMYFVTISKGDIGFHAQLGSSSSFLFINLRKFDKR